jgi:diguanylate cyclase (GGDEF)-like protein/PAS domain S-box-containing protein
MIMEGSASKLVNRDGSVSVLKVLDDVTDREQAKKALIQSESYYRAIFETSGAATVILEEDTTIALANSRFEELTEYSREEMEGVKPWTDFVHPDDVAWMKENHYLRRRDPEKAPNRYEFRLIDRGGEEHTIFLSVGLITGKRQSVASCIDISDHKKAEEALRRSEKYYRAVFETSGSAMFILEENTTISLVNSNFEKLCGYSRLEVEGRKSWFDFVHPEDVHWMKKYHTMRRVDSCSAPQQYEFRYFDRAWNERNGFLTVDVIPDTSESVISFIDITERKAMEEKLKEMSLFDPLTGLYNRAFFEEEMKRLADERHGPLSIIVCDINGLKLVNDTMGHNKGDELVKDTARLLKRCFRSSDITSRIGGDEFAVLLPQSSESVVRECIRRLRRAIERYNESSTGFGLSVSTGYAVEDGPSTDVNAVFKRADDAMYKEKLQQNHSSRNATIQALIKTLEERDRITEGHAGRLCNYAQQLGRSVGLSGERLNDLQLLARFHDLGKVGISDSILFKQSPLTEEEFEEMKRHCEIGHRIAMATSDLAPIAEYILKHHEHWNGQGYPLGLSGEDIPLECRILSIVDAFDSMTSARPYKEAHSREQALKELKRWAGIQFDPDLVDRFARIMHNDNGEGDKKGNT